MRGNNLKGDTRVRARIHAPFFNKEATKLLNLISWDSNVFEPIYTCSLSPDNIREFLDRPMEVPYSPFMVSQWRGLLSKSLLLVKVCSGMRHAMAS